MEPGSASRQLDFKVRVAVHLLDLSSDPCPTLPFGLGLGLPSETPTCLLSLSKLRPPANRNHSLEAFMLVASPSHSNAGVHTEPCPRGPVHSPSSHSKASCEDSKRLQTDLPRAPPYSELASSVEYPKKGLSVTSMQDLCPAVNFSSVPKTAGTSRLV